MRTIVIGALCGAVAGIVPGVLCYLLNEPMFWNTKVGFVILAGTGLIVGTIAGSTETVLEEFRKNQPARGRGRSSPSASEQHP